jgi:ribosome-binding protein aMBF1 (putative translation factor)
MRKQQQKKRHTMESQSAVTEHVARRLHEERVRHGMSQTELGKRPSSRCRNTRRAAIASRRRRFI